MSGSLWQYYRDEPALTNIGVVDDFSCNSASFKSHNNGTIEIFK